MNIPQQYDYPRNKLLKTPLAGGGFLALPCRLQQNEGHYLKFTKHLFASTTNLRDVRGLRTVVFSGEDHDTTISDPCGMKTKGIMFFK